MVIQDVVSEFGVMGPRKKYFTDDWMSENFDQYHKMHMGADAPVPKMGYPDTGAGYYSKKLPYKAWYELNCAQRIHGNSMEHMSWCLPLILISGVFQPQMTAFLTSIVITGRELYRFGYMSKQGHSSFIRELGAYPLNIAEMLMIFGLGSIFYRKRFENIVKNRSFYKSWFVQRDQLTKVKVEQQIKDE